MKLAYNFQRFPVQNLGFNDYRSRARTVFSRKHEFQKIPKIQLIDDGRLNPPTLSLEPLAKPLRACSVGS